MPEGVTLTLPKSMTIEQASDVVVVVDAGLDPVLHSYFLELVEGPSHHADLLLLISLNDIVKEFSTQWTGSSLNKPSCLRKLFSRLFVDNVG